MTTPYAFASRHIDKPWGYELIWAESETYVGRSVVRAGGRSAPSTTSEGRVVARQSGRASLELGPVGGELESLRSGQDCFRYRPGTASRHGADHDDSRGLTPHSMTSCGSTMLRPPGARRPS
jgi:hypothetical protein